MVLRQAILAHQNGHFADAARLYGSVLEQNPWQPDTLYLLGLLARSLGNIEGARHNMISALLMAPGLIDHYSRWLPLPPSPRDVTDEAAERAAFAAAAAQALRDGIPIKIQFGTGDNLMPDFFNLDYQKSLVLEASGWFAAHANRYFIHPVGPALPFPDGSVDFVFSEDFIEHLAQKDQVQYLAEAFRVLKPGSVHRISTPCLAYSMKSHSDFSKGAAGVYQKEWDDWGHQVVFTRTSLRDLAQMIGYRDVIFTGKNQSISPHRCIETRPGSDRSGDEANIYADLIK